MATPASEYVSPGSVEYGRLVESSLVPSIVYNLKGVPMGIRTSLLDEAPIVSAPQSSSLWSEPKATMGPTTVDKAPATPAYIAPATVPTAMYPTADGMDSNPTIASVLHSDQAILPSSQVYWGQGLQDLPQETYGGSYAMPRAAAPQTNTGAWVPWLLVLAAVALIVFLGR